MVTKTECAVLDLRNFIQAFMQLDIFNHCNVENDIACFLLQTRYDELAKIDSKNGQSSTQTKVSMYALGKGICYLENCK